MKEGDTCVTYSAGHEAGAKDLEEQESSNSASSTIFLIVGGLVMLGAGWATVRSLRGAGRGP
ncbi:hypothetical protein GCM10010302_42860 [Streptomyces polychromogenes]|uniref:LPXTG cell wall anchor domain-containing protein n=1 Tax=Streptomyces polychromogenes TaxID=67342 RepID=A0ABN0VGT4_9ACTN